MVLTLVGSLKSGLHTFRMSRRNGSTMCQSHLHSTVPGIKLRLWARWGLKYPFVLQVIRCYLGVISTMGLHNRVVIWPAFSIGLEPYQLIAHSTPGSWTVQIYGLHLWNGYWMSLPVSCQMVSHLTQNSAPAECFHHWNCTNVGNHYGSIYPGSFQCCSINSYNDD